MDTIDEEVLLILCNWNLLQTASVSADQTSCTQLNETLPLSAVPEQLPRSRPMNKKACDVCGQIFFSITSLVKHQQYHDLNRPYQCYICEKRFRIQSHLHSHLKVHSKRRFFTCEICNRSLSSKYHLKSHMTVHTKKERYDSQQYNNLNKHCLPGTMTPAILQTPITPAPVTLIVKDQAPLAPSSNVITTTKQKVVQKKNLKKKQSMIDVIRNIDALPLCYHCGKPVPSQHHKKFHNFRKNKEASLNHNETQALERVSYDIEVVL